MSPFKPFKPFKTALLKGSFTIKKRQKGEESLFEDKKLARRWESHPAIKVESRECEKAPKTFMMDRHCFPIRLGLGI
jgi:hypothetical protein